MRRSLRHTAAVVFAVVAIPATLGPANASAHVQLVSSSPRSGSVVKRSLSVVRVTFTGPIRSGTLTVTGPGRQKVSLGAGGRDPRSIKRLAVGLRSGLTVGTYTVRAGIIAADGHREKWTFSFRTKK